MLEYTTEIAGERYGADERAQFEVTVNDDGVSVRDRLYKKEVSMTQADFDALYNIVSGYLTAKYVLEGTR